MLVHLNEIVIKFSEIIGTEIDYLNFYIKYF